MDINIEGRPELTKRGHVVINKDKEGFLQFLMARDAREKEISRIKSLEDQVSALTGLVEEMLRSKK